VQGWVAEEVPEVTRAPIIAVTRARDALLRASRHKRHWAGMIGALSCDRSSGFEVAGKVVQRRGRGVRRGWCRRIRCAASPRQGGRGHPAGLRPAGAERGGLPPALARRAQEAPWRGCWLAFRPASPSASTRMPPASSCSGKRARWAWKGSCRSAWPLPTGPGRLGIGSRSKTRTALR
jgi:hypothetical protein